MTLVDACEREASVDRQSGGEVQEAPAQQALRRNEQDLQRPGAQRIHDSSGMLWRLAAMQRRARQALWQVCQLVFHQRNKRTHYQRHAGQHESRQLRDGMR